MQGIPVSILGMEICWTSFFLLQSAISSKSKEGYGFITSLEASHFFKNNILKEV